MRTVSRLSTAPVTVRIGNSNSCRHTAKALDNQTSAARVLYPPSALLGLMSPSPNIANWRRHYNDERPHRSLGYVPTASYARQVA
jgi:hypothetical protein